VLPLVQAARNKREWLRTVAIVTLSMVLVSALWGAIVGTPAAALAGTVGSKRAMALIMQPTLIIMGALMLVVALSELGLIRRLLPDIQLPMSAAEGAANLAGGGPDRRALILGLTMGATFGIICNRPLYVVLLLYVALTGGMLYGALALGAYGLGLAISIAVVGLVLLPTGRSTRLANWLGERQEAFHVVQGVAFAVMGAISLTFFLVRYGPLIPPA
jgi:cytochrome c biogenesis protein CcdA